MLVEYKGKKPIIGKNVFIAPTAVIIGDVTIGDNASIWFGTVLRGDMAAITIGENSNIQDNCTIHTDMGIPCVIGNNVAVGHNAVVHGCTVEDNCLIGINAVVLNRALIQHGSVVAAGSVVLEGQSVGPYHMVTGAPAKLKRELNEELFKKFSRPIKGYLTLSREYLKASTT